MRLEGSWPRSKDDLNYLTACVQKHFSKDLRRVRIRVVRGSHDYVFEVEAVGKYVELRVSAESPILDAAFTLGFVDSIVEHESKHIELAFDWKLVVMKAPLVVLSAEGPDEQKRLIEFQTYSVEREITEVFATARMSDVGLKKYAEWLNYELQFSWNRTKEIVFSGRMPKSLYMFYIARQELVARKAGISLPAAFDSIKYAVTPNDQDKAIYNDILSMYGHVWEQARADPPKLEVIEPCKRISDALLSQTSPYIAKQ